MANSKESSNIRNFMYSGKHALLPPKSPFPSVSSSYVDYVPSGLVGSKSVSKPKESNTHHQRTSSETFLMEEQPSWLDDLLNEPETPVRRGGHRRSSSDSFAYLDVANISNIDYAAPDEYKYKNRMPSSWGSQDFDKDAWQTFLYADVNAVKQKNRTWDSNLRSAPNSGGFPSARENTVSQNSGPSCAIQEVDGVLSSSNEKQNPVDSAQHDSKTSSEKKDGSHAKSSASDNDTKRAKQQFAQRSRVRKLQYIAELERNVQALQAEGSEVSAELEFLNQQHLILSMENKALKHRLESLAQEQLLKYVEHEVLEKEIGRLRTLYQQQYQQQNQVQQPQSLQKQHQPSSHRRTNSRDLESQFGTLSLKNKDTNSGRESVTGSLRI